MYVERIASEYVIIYHCAQQIVCGSYGVQVAREVQVDICHGHHLGVSAAGSAALYAENGTERRFPQGEADLFAEARQGIGKPY